jgi:hypothetical protein
MGDDFLAGLLLKPRRLVRIAGVEWRSGAEEGNQLARHQDFINFRIRRRQRHFESEPERVEQIDDVWLRFVDDMNLLTRGKRSLLKECDETVLGR